MNFLKLTAVFIGLTLSSPVTADIQRVSENPGLRQSANVVQLEILIDAPVNEVWNLVATRFDQSKLYNVEAKSTGYIRGNSPKVGAQRRTIGNDGKFIDVEIFAYSPRNHVISWEIIGTDVAKMVVGYASYHLEAAGKGTRITQTAGFKLQSPVMNVFARGQFPKLFKTELAAIKHILEQKQPVTKSMKRMLRDTYYSKIVERRSY